MRGIDNYGDIVGILYCLAGAKREVFVPRLYSQSCRCIDHIRSPWYRQRYRAGRDQQPWADLVGHRYSSFAAFASIADGSFPFLTVPGAQGYSPVPAAVNDTGRVAGSYSDGAVFHGFLATPSTGSTQPLIRTAAPGVITALGFGGAPSIAPYSWIEIYGENLASTTRAWAASDFSGNAAPTSLSGVTVSIGGVPAVVSYISPGQVNAFVPPAALTAGPVQVTVSNGTQTSAPYIR